MQTAWILLPSVLMEKSGPLCWMGCLDYVYRTHAILCCRTSLPGNPVAKWIIIWIAFEMTKILCIFLNSFSTHLTRDNSSSFWVVTVGDLRFLSRWQISKQSVLSLWNIIWNSSSIHMTFFLPKLLPKYTRPQPKCSSWYILHGGNHILALSDTWPCP